MQAALQDLVHAIAGAASAARGRPWSVQQAQLLWDLEFLQRLSEAGESHRVNGNAQQNGASDPTHALQNEVRSSGSLHFPRRAHTHMSQLLASMPKAARSQWSSHLETTLQQQLARTQLLLSPLLSLDAWDTLALPSATRTPLLPLGAPPAAQDARVELGQSQVPRFVLIAS